MPTYTVVGLCEEQRHAFVVRARNPNQAERSARKLHDKDGRSYRFRVAGVVKGEVHMVDTRDCGWEDP